MKITKSIIGLLIALAALHTAPAMGDSERLGAALARGVMTDAKSSCNTFVLETPNCTSIVRLAADGEIAEVINIWDQWDRAQFYTSAKALNLHRESLPTALPVEESFKSDPWHNSTEASALVEQVKSRAMPKLKSRPKC